MMLLHQIRTGLFGAVLTLLSAVPLAQGQTPPASSPTQAVRLGIAAVPVPFAVLEQRGLEHGVLVGDVLEGWPADQAGVRPHDVIVSVDGAPAYSLPRLRWLLERAKSPDSIALSLWRDGAMLDLVVDTTAAPAATAMPGATAEGVDAEVARQPYLGIRMQPPRGPDSEADADAPAGVVVAEALEDGPAAAAGIRAGDVLVRFDRRELRHPADLSRAMACLRPGDTVELTLLRDSETRSLQLELGGVAPSRFHGGYPPQAPFPTWRNRTHPWMDPWHHAPLPMPAPDSYRDGPLRQGPAYW
jgi:S1-C subfamily serine protease